MNQVTPTLVSILLWIPDQTNDLAATLDNLLAQTGVSVDLHLLDASEHGVAEAMCAQLSQTDRERTNCLRFPPGTSRLVAEVVAAANCKADYVALSRTGTLSTPDRLSAALSDLETTPNLGMICSQVQWLDSNGKAVRRPDLDAFNTGEAIMRRRLPREGAIIDPDTCVLRRDLLQAHRPNLALSAAGHLPLWLEILDNAEILRHNEIRVRHREAPPPADTTLAAARQQVAAIIGALRRWSLEQQFRFATAADSPQRSIETAAAHAQLARQLIDLDRRFFGHPAQGCQEAYLHALNAMALHPDMVEAQDALQLAEACLGERPDGQRPLADWQATQPLPVPHGQSPAERAEQEAYRKWQAKHALQDIDGQYLAEHMVQCWQQKPAFAVFSLPDRHGHSLPPAPCEALYPARLTSASPEGGRQLSDLLSALNTDTTAGSIDWLLLLPPHTTPDSATLMHLAEAINRAPAMLAWYGDDELTNGRTLQPRFKPEFDPLLASGSNYIGTLAVRRDVAALFGHLPLDAATPLALALALHAAQLRSAIGHIPEILTHLPEASLAELRHATPACLARHHETHHPAARLSVISPDATAVHWPALPTPPRISLILLGPPGQPAGNGTALLAATDYPALEVIAPSIAPTDFATACREAALAATGEFIVLLGPDAQPGQPDWLSDALALLMAGDYAAVGIAGARTEPPHSLWGAGVVLGLGGGFDSLHANTSEANEAGHLCRRQLAHECSAISAHGMLIRRTRFIDLGGFDPQWALPEACAADFCLRLTRQGGRLAWTPHGALRRAHGEFVWPAPAAGQQIQLRDRFIARWLDQLAADPYWNRHLSLETPSALPEDDLVFRWHPDYRDRLRVLALPMPASGQAAYRVTEPLLALDAAGMIQTQFACEPMQVKERAPTPIELERLAPDTLYLQASIDDVRFHGLRSAAHFNPGIFRIFSLDDRVSDMPAYNASSRALPRDVVIRRMSEALRCSNRLLVSTEPLAELYRKEIDDIVVVPNRLQKSRWCQLDIRPGGNTRPRVGWAGALQHAGDLAMIREVVEATAKDIDWVFFGMMPAGCEPYVKEFHGTVHLNDYPAKLASLGLDLAVAPLEVNLFNESKSNLRLLEYGIFGWPVVCSDIYPFQTNHAPVCRVPNRAAAWIVAIREHLGDRQALAARGRELQAWVQRHYLLEDHLDDWLNALSPR